MINNVTVYARTSNQTGLIFALASHRAGTHKCHSDEESLNLIALLSTADHTCVVDTECKCDPLKQHSHRIRAFNKVQTRT